MSINLQKYPLDDEMQTFLRRCAEHYPETSGALSAEDNRRLYLSLCDVFNYPKPQGMSVANQCINANGVDIPVRRYTPTDWQRGEENATTVVYYHGGGFVVGNLDSHDSICADLAAGSQCELIAVDYRLSPEWVHPAAFDDALAVFRACDNGRTIIAGDSAGGTLTGAVAAATRGDAQKPVGQVLIYPWLGGELFDLDSYATNADAPGLTTSDLGKYREMRTHRDQNTSDYTYYPLALSDFSDMPPCISFAAEFDPLRDDSAAYVSKLKDAGVFAENHVYPGLTHGCLRARRVSQKAGAYFSGICDAISKLATQ